MLEAGTFASSFDANSRSRWVRLISSLLSSTFPPKALTISRLRNTSCWTGPAERQVLNAALKPRLCRRLAGEAVSRVANPFRGIDQRAQKCRELVIHIPPRRDGNIEAPASQSAPIQPQHRQQASQPRRQPRSLQRAQTDDLVDVRVGYEERAKGILHHHRAGRSGKGALQFPEERRCQDHVAQPIEPDDQQREPIATMEVLCRLPAPGGRARRSPTLSARGQTRTVAAASVLSKPESSHDGG